MCAVRLFRFFPKISRHSHDINKQTRMCGIYLGICADRPILSVILLPRVVFIQSTWGKMDAATCFTSLTKSVKINATTIQWSRNIAFPRIYTVIEFFLHHLWLGMIHTHFSRHQFYAVLKSCLKEQLFPL